LTYEKFKLENVGEIKSDEQKVDNVLGYRIDDEVNSELENNTVKSNQHANSVNHLTPFISYARSLESHKKSKVSWWKFYGIYIILFLMYIITIGVCFIVFVCRYVHKIISSISLKIYSERVQRKETQMFLKNTINIDVGVAGSKYNQTECPI
jgi:hypothetical protein